MSSQDKPLQIKLDKQSIVKLVDNLKLTKEKAKEYAIQAVAMASNEVERVAKNIVPLDKAPLMTSIHAENPIEKSDRIIGTVQVNKEYAFKQHENLHYKHLPGRKAKYLEGPLKEIGVDTLKNYITGIISYLAKYVKGGETI